MKLEIHFFLKIILILLVTSCTNSRFQRQKFTQLKKIQTQVFESSSKNKTELKDISQSPNPNNKEIETAHLLSPIKEMPKKENVPEDELYYSDLDDCGDKIVLINGEEIEVRIIEVTAEGIVYRKCSNLTGPEYTKSREEVSEIIYEDGKRQTITEVKEEEEVNDNLNGSKPIEPFAIASWITVFIFFLCFVGIGFSITSLIILKRNPDIYDQSSKWWALGSLLLNSAMLVWLSYILFVF